MRLKRRFLTFKMAQFIFKMGKGGTRFCVNFQSLRHICIFCIDNVCCQRGRYQSKLSCCCFSSSTKIYKRSTQFNHSQNSFSLCSIFFQLNFFIILIRLRRFSSLSFLHVWCALLANVNRCEHAKIIPNSNTTVYIIGDKEKSRHMLIENKVLPD